MMGGSTKAWDLSTGTRGNSAPKAPTGGSLGRSLLDARLNFMLTPFSFAKLIVSVLYSDAWAKPRSTDDLFRIIASSMS